ncbi:hypothetical protein [Amycolatopsis sp. cmx-11-12]|uniref:hypothetical protein n=1 Tax=Amycolatopsis sp. cmx-11-12 TaxID=2785795 RepID=UPI003917D87C
MEVTPIGAVASVAERATAQPRVVVVIEHQALRDGATAGAPPALDVSQQPEKNPAGLLGGHAEHEVVEGGGVPGMRAVGDRAVDVGLPAAQPPQLRAASRSAAVIVWCTGAECE